MGQTKAVPDVGGTHPGIVKHGDLLVPQHFVGPFRFGFGCDAMIGTWNAAQDNVDVGAIAVEFSSDAGQGARSVEEAIDDGRFEGAFGLLTLLLAWSAVVDPMLLVGCYINVSYRRRHGSWAVGDT